MAVDVDVAYRSFSKKYGKYVNTVKVCVAIAYCHGRSTGL